MSATLDNIPQEIKISILNFLTIKDLKRVSQVNKDFHAISLYEPLWKDHFPTLDCLAAGNLRKFYIEHTPIRNTDELFEEVSSSVKEMSDQGTTTLLIECRSPYTQGCYIAFEITRNTASLFDRTVRKKIIFPSAFTCNTKGKLEAYFVRSMSSLASIKLRVHYPNALNDHYSTWQGCVKVDVNLIALFASHLHPNLSFTLPRTNGPAPVLEFAPHITSRKSINCQKVAIIGILCAIFALMIQNSFSNIQ